MENQKRLNEHVMLVIVENLKLTCRCLQIYRYW